MMQSFALIFSLLALLISVITYYRVKQEIRLHEQNVAAALEAALDELEAENRRFIEELQTLHQEFHQQYRNKDEPRFPDLHPSTATTVEQVTNAHQEAVKSQDTVSTFQALLEEVLAMKRQGRSEVEIARQMNRGVCEIQFILQSAAYQQKKRS